MLRIFKIKAQKMFVQIRDGDGRSSWLTKNNYVEKMIEEQKTKCGDYQGGNGTSRFSESSTIYTMIRQIN